MRKILLMGKPFNLDYNLAYKKLNSIKQGIKLKVPVTVGCFFDV